MPLGRLPTRRLGRLGAAVAVINGSSSYAFRGGIPSNVGAKTIAAVTPAVATPVVTPTALVPPPVSKPVTTVSPPAIVSPVNPAPATTARLPIQTPITIQPMPQPSQPYLNYAAIAGAAGKLTGSYATQAINYIAGTSYSFGGGGYGGAYAAFLKAVIPSAPASSAAGQLSSTLGTAGTALGVVDTLLNTVGWSNPVTAVAAVVVDIASALANVIGNTHPEGHDQFVLIKPNGGGVMLDNETPNAGSARTTAWATAYVQGFGAVVAALLAKGYTLTYPAQIIEVRDDGVTPAELHTNVIPMTAAEQAQYNLPGGYKGDSTWNDRLASNYVSLGPPGNLTGVVQAWMQWVISNGYIHAPIKQPLASPQPVPVTTPTVTAPKTPIVVAPANPVAAKPPPVIMPTSPGLTTSQYNLAQLLQQANATGPYAYTPPPAVQTPTSTTGKPKMAYGGYSGGYGGGSYGGSYGGYGGAYGGLFGGSYGGGGGYGYTPTPAYNPGYGGGGGYGGLLSAAGGAIGAGLTYANYAAQRTARQAAYQRAVQYRQQRIAAYRQARQARIVAARQARQARILAARKAAQTRAYQRRLMRLRRMATGG